MGFRVKGLGFGVWGLRVVGWRVRGAETPTSLIQEFALNALRTG